MTRSTTKPLKESLMTAALTEAPASLLDILNAGSCSPVCLLSQEQGRCNCRCQGRHHGAMVSALLQASAE